MNWLIMLCTYPILSYILNLLVGKVEDFRIFREADQYALDIFMCLSV